MTPRRVELVKAVFDEPRAILADPQGDRSIADRSAGAPATSTVGRREEHEPLHRRVIGGGDGSVPPSKERGGGTSRMKAAVAVVGVILSLGAFVAVQQQASSQVPPSVNTAARSRLEFPEQAFEACNGKMVGAACSVGAGEHPSQGTCAKAAAPGRMFCFRAP
jgi:hypothetical protein